MLTRLSRSPTNDSDEPTDELTPGCGAHRSQLRSRSPRSLLSISGPPKNEIQSILYLLCDVTYQYTLTHTRWYPSTHLECRLKDNNLKVGIVQEQKISSSLQVHTTKQDTSLAVTRFSEVIRKFATDVRLEGKGWGGSRWPEQDLRGHHPLTELSRTPAAAALSPLRDSAPRGNVRGQARWV